MQSKNQIPPPRSHSLFPNTDFLSTHRLPLSFFLLGLINNTPFLIMLACAKSISDSSTALVFLACNVPGLVTKASGPYWFDRVGERTRLRIGSCLMACSFVLVGIFGWLGEKSGGEEGEGKRWEVVMQLIGVGMVSVQCSLGECSLLALGGRADSYSRDREESYGERKERGDKTSLCISAFSAGTGISGMVGFGYIFVLRSVMQFSIPVVLGLAALLLPSCYWGVYSRCAEEPALAGDRSLGGWGFGGRAKKHDGSEDELSSRVAYQCANNPIGPNATEENNEFNDNGEEKPFVDHPLTVHNRDHNDQHDPSAAYQSLSTSIFVDDTDGIDEDDEDDSSLTATIDTHRLTPLKKFKLTLSLYPYTIPLFTVYFAEYALQSGLWTAIGFPTTSKPARDAFYLRSNWCYQIGVFLSRSSGALCIAPLWLLWLMPGLQCLNLVFFYAVASQRFFYNYAILLPMCFYVGLLGGGVYVNGYMRINRDLSRGKREFALSTASVADGFGVFCADLTGLFLQSCLYGKFGIKGAVVGCPVGMRR